MSDDDTPAPRALAVGTTATPVRRAQPAPSPDDSQFAYNKTGKATNFGGTAYQKDPIDPGVGTPALGTGKTGISTANSYGVAVPQKALEKQFGTDKSNWPDMRTARADVTNNDTGETVRMPIIDFGPGREPLEKGVVTDLSKQTQLAWGASSPANVAINVVPNAGPDYAKDTDKWYAEQQKIHDQLTTKTGLPSIGADPAPTPWVKPSAAPDTPANPNPPTQKLSDDEIREQNAAALDDTSEDPAYHWPPN